MSIVMFVCAKCLAGLSFYRWPRARSDDPSSGDRFADEPNRPKAQSGVHFLESYSQAREEAQRSGRRLFVYFTGQNCGWCRVMEKRTLTDAEVVELSRSLVCVKLDMGNGPRLADELAVDAIPRTFVLTSEGKKVDMIAGYHPAAEYANWIRDSIKKSPVQATINQSKAPTPVGATEAQANLLIWFIDGQRTIARWPDENAFTHPQLLKMLRAIGAAHGWSISPSRSSRHVGNVPVRKAVCPT